MTEILNSHKNRKMSLGLIVVMVLMSLSLTTCLDFIQWPQMTVRRVVEFVIAGIVGATIGLAQQYDRERQLLANIQSHDKAVRINVMTLTREFNKHARFIKIRVLMMVIGAVLAIFLEFARHSLSH